MLPNTPAAIPAMLAASADLEAQAAELMKVASETWATDKKKSGEAVVDAALLRAEAALVRARAAKLTT